MADCGALGRETTLQSSQPVPSLEVGGEELFPESAATHLVGLINSSSRQRVGLSRGITVPALVLDGVGLGLRDRRGGCFIVRKMRHCSDFVAIVRNMRYISDSKGAYEKSKRH